MPGITTQMCQLFSGRHSSPKVHCNITFFRKSAGHGRKLKLTALFSATSMSRRTVGHSARRPGTLPIKNGCKWRNNAIYIYHEAVENG